MHILVSVLVSTIFIVALSYGVQWLLAALGMRSYKSYTDLRALARSYLSFSEKHDTQRPRSFSDEGNRSQCSLTCVNFRDCGLVSPLLKEKMVFRSSQVVSSSEIQNLQLKAVLDLRVLKKSCRKHAEDQLLRQVKRSDSRIQAFRSENHLGSTGSSSSDEEEVSLNGQRRSLSSWGSHCAICPICTEAFGKLHDVRVPIYHSDLVPWRTKLKVFSKLPMRTQAKAMGEICHLRNPERVVAAAVVDPDQMGPMVLYKLLLDNSKASVAKALRLFARAENYPVLVHCIHGKDRTGLIIMLLLLICDVPTKLVVADYIQSELQLKAGRDKGDLQELDDFLTSDNVIASKAETMVNTIAHLDTHYGSAKLYAQAIGLSNEDIAQIRINFMKQADHTDLFDRFERGSAPSRDSINKFCRGSTATREVSSPRAPEASRFALSNTDGVNHPHPSADALTASGRDQAAEDEDDCQAVISKKALIAASDAVEEKLGEVDLENVSPELRQHDSEGAISLEKIARPPRSRHSQGARERPVAQHLMDS